MGTRCDWCNKTLPGFRVMSLAFCSSNCLQEWKRKNSPASLSCQWWNSKMKSLHLVLIAEGGSMQRVVSQLDFLKDSRKVLERERAFMLDCIAREGTRL